MDFEEVAYAGAQDSVPTFGNVIGISREFEQKIPLSRFP
jgi:hypothetical protein